MAASHLELKSIEGWLNKMTSVLDLRYFISKVSTLKRKCLYRETLGKLLIVWLQIILWKPLQYICVTCKNIIS